MKRIRCLIDTEDKEQAAFAIGLGLGYKQGVHDMTKGVVAAGLIIGVGTLVGVFAEPIFNRIENKVNDWKEKYRLKKEQKRKAKEEKAE